MAQTDAKTLNRLRVDKWLWAARFFKTRSLASDAIGKNRVKVGGQRIKPSRTLQIGDQLEVEKPPYSFVVTVMGLNDKRRPASEAVQLYEESAASIAAREAQSALSRMDYQVQTGLAGSGRPSKKQRRQIIRFQNQNDEQLLDVVQGIDEMDDVNDINELEDDGHVSDK